MATCEGCGTMVFAAEKMTLNGKNFHKDRGCAKCATCGTNLSQKNFVSVASNDKSQWFCKIHAVNNSKASGYTKMMKRSKTAERFADFLKRYVKEEEERKHLFGVIRASVRKKATKEAFTALTQNKREEIASFLEELRKEDEETIEKGSNPLRKTTSSSSGSYESFPNPMFQNPTFSDTKPNESRISDGSWNTTSSSSDLKPNSSFINAQRAASPIPNSSPLNNAARAFKNNSSPRLPNTKTSNTSRSPFSRVFELTNIPTQSQSTYEDIFVNENINDIDTLRNIDLAGMKLMGVKMGDASQIISALKKLENPSSKNYLNTRPTPPKTFKTPPVVKAAPKPSFGNNKQSRLVSVSMQNFRIKDAKSMFQKN